MNILKIQLLFLPLLFLGIFDNNDSTPTINNASVLTLSVTTQSAAKGEAVCLDIISPDFNQIVSMQYTMQWDRKVLKYKGVQNFNVPAMSAANFGPRTAPEGKLTFSWYDPNVRGITLPAGTSLYQVCFDVIGESGSKAFFQFTDYPTITEIMQTDGTFLDLNWTSGKVTVK